MRQLLDEYGEAVVGAIAALVIIGIAVFLFTGGGVIDSLFTEIANAAI